MKKILLALVVTGLLALIPAFSPQSAPPQLSPAKASTATDQPLTNLRDGSATSIAELSKDKPLFLNFWASWCPPCVGEMPAIDEMYRSYGSRVNFAAVSVDASIEEANAYIRGKGASLQVPFYFGNAEDIAAAYRLDAIPQSFMIAPDGRIIAHHVGGMTPAEMQTFIESAL